MMSDDQINVHEVEHGSPLMADIQARVEYLRRVIAPTIDPDSPASLSAAQTATAIYCGAMFGHMIIAGLARDADKRRATETFAKNFREGIEIGKRHALRVATSEFGGNA